MPLLMTRWFVGYSMHQSNLPKLTYINVPHGQINLARGGRSGRRCVWILALALAN